MNDKPTLSLGGKISPETQARIEKVKQVITQPSDAIVEAPNTNDANVKADSKSNKTETPEPKPEQLDKKHKAIELHKKQIEHAKALYKYHFSYFSKLYPKCFSQAPKPLAVGINKAMLEAESKKPEAEQVSKTAISKFLNKYTRSVAYKEALQSGSARINLQGEEVETVTPEHAEFAKKSLEEWRSRRATHRNNNNKKPKK